MADFPAAPLPASQPGTLKGYGIGPEGNFAENHYRDTCTDASCHFCNGGNARVQQATGPAAGQEVNRQSGGELEVRSSDTLGFVWETKVINYSFDGAARGYQSFDAGYQEKFRAAMKVWSDAANIRFKETTTADADWLIVWKARSDGAGGVLGSARYRDADGDGRMEQGQDSVLISMDRADTRYFMPTAIHEAGHGLGLAHINHAPSIMSTYLNPSRTNITSYDKEVIQSLYGAPKNATIGSSGADNMSSAAENDTLSGGDGSDTLSGGAGDDLIYGNRQTDLIYGGGGADTLFGGQNNGPESGTPLAMREGQETVSGGAGDDLVYGNHGSDQLFGDSGADTLFGGQDGDLLSGGAGNDDLFGNLGADTFVFSASDEGHDTIHDYQSGDAIRLTGGVTVTSRALDSDGDTIIQLSSGTRIELIGHSDPAGVNFDIV